MAKADNFRDLEIWKLGMELAKAVFGATSEFPSSETYGLTSQMRRASVSIPSNIAEGFNRRSRPDMARFLAIASGSAAELETQVELARAFGYLAEGAAAALLESLDHLSRMITLFHQKLTRGKHDPTIPRSHGPKAP